MTSPRDETHVEPLNGLHVLHALEGTRGRLEILETNRYEKCTCTYSWEE